MDVSERLDFVQALEFLNKGNSILPILQPLTLREHVSLRNILLDNPFNNAAYDNLRTTIRNQRIAAFETHLKLICPDNNGNALSAFLRAICTGHNLVEQHELVDSIVRMSQHDRSNILNALDLHVKGDLHNLLQNVNFSDPIYNELKALVQPIAGLHHMAALPPLPPVAPAQQHQQVKQPDKKKSRFDHNE